LDCGTAEPREAEPDVEPRFRLQIPQVTVPLGETREQRCVEREAASWLKRVEPVFFVDRLTAHDGPPAGAPLEEIVEPARADDVDEHSVDRRSLVDRHFRLRDRAIAAQLDRRAAEEMN